MALMPKNTDGLHCFAIPAILEQRKRNKMAYHTILLRKFFFVCSVFMIIKKEPFRILLHVLIKHVPSKLHIQNRNHADTCRSADFSASGQALDRLVAVSSKMCIRDSTQPAHCNINHRRKPFWTGNPACLHNRSNYCY